MPHLHAACPPFPPWAGRAASTHCADDLRISCASPRSPKACPCLGCWPSSALLPLRGWHYVNRRDRGGDVAVSGEDHDARLGPGLADRRHDVEAAAVEKAQTENREGGCGAAPHVLAPIGRAPD